MCTLLVTGTVAYKFLSDAARGVSESLQASGPVLSVLSPCCAWQELRGDEKAELLESMSADGLRCDPR